MASGPETHQDQQIVDDFRPPQMIMGSAGKDAKSASASAGLAAAAKLRRTEVKLAAAALLAMFRVCDIGFADGDLFTANPTWQPH